MKTLILTLLLASGLTFAAHASLGPQIGALQAAPKEEHFKSGSEAPHSEASCLANPPMCNKGAEK